MQAELPPVDEGGHLLDVLFQIGPVVATGFGAAPISELELAAWQFNQHTRLEPWECAIIRQLSREYAAMLSEATNPNCPAPYTVDADAAARASAVRDKFKAMAALRNVKGAR